MLPGVIILTKKNLSSSLQGALFKRKSLLHGGDILFLLNSSHIGRDKSRKLEKNVFFCKYGRKNLEVFLFAVNNVIDQFP